MSGCGDMYSDMYENSLDMQIDMLGYTYNEHIITKIHDESYHLDMYTYIQWYVATYHASRQWYVDLSLDAPSDRIYTYHDAYHECFGVMIHIWSSTGE